MSGPPFSISNDHAYCLYLHQFGSCSAPPLRFSGFDPNQEGQPCEGLPQTNDQGQSMNPFEQLLVGPDFNTKDPAFPEDALKKKERTPDDLAVADAVKAVQASYIQVVSRSSGLAAARGRRGGAFLWPSLPLSTHSVLPAALRSDVALWPALYSPYPRLFATAASVYASVLRSYRPTPLSSRTLPCSWRRSRARSNRCAPQCTRAS